jgi:hypothetical protein
MRRSVAIKRGLVFVVFVSLLVYFHQTLSTVTIRDASYKQPHTTINRDDVDVYDKDDLSKYAVPFNPNDLIGHANGYKNSKGLREQLKPKLSKAYKENHDMKNSILWDDVGAAHDAADVKKRDEGYKLYAFNTLVSSRLSLSREIPDTRHKACKNVKYPPANELPTASVVICFYREDLSTLLRTVHSVINRSPKEALHEVILVNDRSDIDIIANITSHFREKKLAHLVKLFTAPEV